MSASAAMEDRPEPKNANARKNTLVTLYSAVNSQISTRTVFFPYRCAGSPVEEITFCGAARDDTLVFAYFSVTSLSSVVHIFPSRYIVVFFKKKKKTERKKWNQHLWMCFFFFFFSLHPHVVIAEKVIFKTRGIKCIFDFAVIRAYNFTPCVGVTLHTFFK